MTRFALSFLVILGLVGCGTMQTTASYETDLAKVAAIERAATLQGVQVYWVNKPRRLVAGG
jgi:hypothetical protein